MTSERANTVRPYEQGTTEDAFRKITAKFAGGRGNPPLRLDRQTPNLQEHKKAYIFIIDKNYLPI